jgi:hypothetical protein
VLRGIRTVGEAFREVGVGVDVQAGAAAARDHLQ